VKRADHRPQKANDVPGEATDFDEVQVPHRNLSESTAPAGKTVRSMPDATCRC
jgi:hypothetical protein